MAERASWATMDGSTGRIIDVEDARLALGALWTPGDGAVDARGGIRPAAGNPGTVTASTTPDANVHVAAFQCVIPASRGVGPYVATLDADKTVDVLTATPADPSNPRVDLIVAVQTDTYYGDGSTAFEVRHIVGDPAAQPLDPLDKIPSPDYILRARVTVPANANAISDTDIEVVPAEWTVALGGLLPVATQGERDALDAYDGMQIWRRDRDWIEVHDGTAWRVQGVAICTSTADRNAAITNPRSGQLAMTTDRDILWQWDGATDAWSALVGAVPRFSAHQVASQSLPDGTWTALEWQSGGEILDNWSAHADGSTEYVVPLAGRYRVRGKCTVDAIGSGKTVGVAVMRNDATVPGGGAFAGSTPIPSSAVVAPPAFACQVGDRIEVAGYQLSGGAVGTASAGDVASTIEVEYVGP